MNKKIFKISKIIIALCITTILVVSLVVSQDECHLEACEDEHCIYCMIIQIAQNLIRLSTIIINIVMIGVLIYLFLSKLRKENKVFVLVSLVFQKVQLNE